MLLTVRKQLPLGLALLSLAALAGAFMLLYQAGCAGDTKGAALGNPVHALHLEGLAMLPFAVGMVSGTGAIALAGGTSSGRRAALATGFLLIGGVFLWVLGVQFEIWGVQSCFAS
jgi:hypothetical protein